MTWRISICTAVSVVFSSALRSFTPQVIRFSTSDCSSAHTKCYLPDTHSVRSDNQQAQPATMSYNRHRYETLRRLGIEQLPAIVTTSEWEDPNQSADYHTMLHPFGGDLPVRTMPVRLTQSHSIVTHTDTTTGPWSPLPQMSHQGPDRLGHTGQALPSVRNRGQLRRSPCDMTWLLAM